MHLSRTTILVSILIILSSMPDCSVGFRALPRLWKMTERNQMLTRGLRFEDSLTKLHGVLPSVASEQSVDICVDDQLGSEETQPSNDFPLVSASKLPIVAVIGRPNTGKSTFVNRITNSYMDGAIVHDAPGVTRDRVYKIACYDDFYYQVVDTGGIVLEDTEDVFAQQIKQQSIVAMEQAEVLIVVMDGQEGITKLDRELASFVRRKFSKIPKYLAVNKCESETKGQLQALEFWELGLGTPYPISAIHGHGISDILDEIVGHDIPKITEFVKENSTNIALIGRPNVGKSSIFNRLYGSERVIVSEQAGTTRDCVDATITRSNLKSFDQYLKTPINKNRNKNRRKQKHPSRIRSSSSSSSRSSNGNDKKKTEKSRNNDYRYGDPGNPSEEDEEGANRIVLDDFEEPVDNDSRTSVKSGKTSEVDYNEDENDYDDDENENDDDDDDDDEEEDDDDDDDDNEVYDDDEDDDEFDERDFELGDSADENNYDNDDLEDVVDYLPKTVGNNKKGSSMLSVAGSKLPRAEIKWSPSTSTSSTRTTSVTTETTANTTKSTTASPANPFTSSASFTIIDTAGIRRRSKIAVKSKSLHGHRPASSSSSSSSNRIKNHNKNDNNNDDNKNGQEIEAVMVDRAFKAIQRCDVCLLIIDATEGIVDQDLQLASKIVSIGRACVIVLNKWDKIAGKDDETYNKAVDNVRLQLPNLKWAEVITTSATTGQRTEKLLEAVQRAHSQYMRTISTALLNDVLIDALQWQAPPTIGNRKGKLYYCNQISTSPPTFLLFVNDVKLFTENYQKYLEKKIRKEFELLGTPIKLVLRGKSLRDLGKLTRNGRRDMVHNSDLLQAKNRRQTSEYYEKSKKRVKR